MTSEKLAKLRPYIHVREFEDGTWGWQYDGEKVPKWLETLRSYDKRDLEAGGFKEVDGVYYVIGYFSEDSCLTDAYIDYANFLPEDLFD